jgi:hypothetical protein
MEEERADCDALNPEGSAWPAAKYTALRLKCDVEKMFWSHRL